MLLHLVAGLIIILLALLMDSMVGNHSSLTILVFGAAGFLFWQLLYVIPLTIWLSHRGKIGMMKGVMIGAVLTALLNGTCFLLLG